MAYMHFMQDSGNANKRKIAMCDVRTYSLLWEYRKKVIVISHKEEAKEAPTREWEMQ